MPNDYLQFLKCLSFRSGGASDTNNTCNCIQKCGKRFLLLNLVKQSKATRVQIAKHIVGTAEEELASQIIYFAIFFDKLNMKTTASTAMKF